MVVRKFNLFEWAEITDSQIADLADLAFTEKWDFNDGEGKYRILREYLANTFTRTNLENKLYAKGGHNESEAGSIIWNTGLLGIDNTYIYMNFGKDEQDHWFLQGFFTSETVDKLFKARNLLPDKVDYFEDDIDNIYINPNKCTFTFNLPGMVDKHKKQFMELIFHLDADYSLAIPMYDVEKDEMVFALPFDMDLDGKVDCALVVRKSTMLVGIEKIYDIYEVISLENAYINCRTIKKVNSKWLEVNNI